MVFIAKPMSDAFGHGLPCDDCGSRNPSVIQLNSVSDPEQGRWTICRRCFEEHNHSQELKDEIKQVLRGHLQHQWQLKNASSDEPFESAWSVVKNEEYYCKYCDSKVTLIGKPRDDPRCVCGRVLYKNPHSWTD